MTRVNLIKRLRPWPFVADLGNGLFVCIHNVKACKGGRTHKLDGDCGNAAERTICGLPVTREFAGSDLDAITCRNCDAAMDKRILERLMGAQ